MPRSYGRQERVALAYAGCCDDTTPGEFSISYLAGWSEHTPIATIERTAALIDRLSRRIEEAVDTVTLADLGTAPGAASTRPHGSWHMPSHAAAMNPASH